jgi:hypothetical protein
MITASNGGNWNVAKDYPELNTFLQNLKTANGNKGGMFERVSVGFPHPKPELKTILDCDLIQY